jgi:hypothetical protein
MPEWPGAGSRFVLGVVLVAATWLAGARPPAAAPGDVGPAERPVSRILDIFLTALSGEAFPYTTTAC